MIFDEWAADDAVVLFSAFRADDGFDRSFELVGRFLVEDVDSAADGVTAVQGALWSTQYLDTLDVPEGRASRGQQVFRVDAVHVSGHTRITAQSAEVPAYTTHGCVVGLNGGGRNVILQVFLVPDTKIFQEFAGEGGDRNRSILDGRFTSLCGDDNFLDLTTATTFGCGCQSGKKQPSANCARKQPCAIAHSFLHCVSPL